MGRVLKRSLDLFIACAGLVLLLPLLLIIAASILLTMGRPILFRQLRPGRNEVPFALHKFRTMNNALDATGKLMDDRQRLTRLGAFLRTTSLDELPELWNVLVGEMSLVGPRPLLLRYLPFFSERERVRCRVRPGITGLAQIKGRNETGWSERLAYDVWYVEHWTFGLDIHILLNTIISVITRDGVVADPHSRMLDLDQERRRWGVPGGGV